MGEECDESIGCIRRWPIVDELSNMAQQGHMKHRSLPFALGCSLLAGLLLVGWPTWNGASLLATFLRTDLDAASKVQAFQTHFESYGIFAPIAYVLLVTVEVVIAPLPGTLLYAPGGAVFGAFWGGLLSLLGNVLGAALAFQIMRRFGQSWARRIGDHDTLSRLQAQLSRHGVGIVFLLRVNPLTSSDLVSYAAGLTPMPLWKLCLGTTLGMAPLCWLQSYASDQLLRTYPGLIYPLLVAGLTYLLLMAVFLVRTMRQTRPVDETDLG